MIETSLVTVTPAPMQLPMMTEREARAAVGAINRHMEGARRMLLELHEREGWRALGYDSWRACVVKEFHYSQAHLYNQLSAARVEQELSTIVETDLPPLREYHLRQIAQLPAEERRAVATELARGELKPRELTTIVKQQREAAPKREPLLPVEPAPLVLPSDCDIREIDAAQLPGEWAGKADLTVTSYPYGIGIEGNGYVDFTSYSEYLQASYRWLKQTWRASADRGRLALVIPIDTRYGSEPRPLYVDTVRLAVMMGWEYQTTIVWSKAANGQTGRSTARGSFGTPNAPLATTGTELVPVFYKGEWNLGRASEPSDITRDEFIDWTNGLWTIGGRDHPDYPAVYPEGLVERLIKLYSYPGSTVADYHLGSGTTAEVAVRLGRRFIGGDKNPHAVALARRAVAQVLK